MILVDTSVWVDHLRAGNDRLSALLERGMVLMHPLVVGEIACGSLADRATILGLLQDLPMSGIAETDEVLAYIERKRLSGRGIGYVDVHLLASAAIAAADLWTLDKRLRAAAELLGCAYRDSGPH